MIFSDGTGIRLRSCIDLTGFELAAGVLVELHVDQVPEQLALGLKVGWRAAVLDSAVVQDDDLVHRANGRQAMWQNNQRSSGGQSRERVVEQMTRFFIDWHGRFLDD